MKNKTKQGFTPLEKIVNFKQRIFKEKPSLTGFTLIEILVSLGIFFVLITMIIGSAVFALRAQRKALAFQNTIDNIRFSLEIMSRSIRQSALNGSVVNGNNASLTIDHPNKGVVLYDLSGGVLRENGQPLTGSNVNVQRLNFYAQGVGSGDPEQARVVISFTLEAQGIKAEEKSKLDLQTTVSIRERD